MLSKEAEQGNPFAQYTLFEALMFGHQGVEINKARAEELCRKAAIQGHPDAMVRMSQYFPANNVEKVFYQQMAALLEMVFLEKTGYHLFEDLYKDDWFFMNQDFKKLYEDNKSKFDNDYINSCLNFELTGIKYTSTNLFRNTEFSAYYLSPEERKEVSRKLLSWTPLLTWSPSGSSLKEKRVYAIKAESEKKEIKPDGITQIAVSAQLYSYISGDKTSSRPIEGKSLNFEIVSTENIKPGKLSSSTGKTDYDGKVTFTYTAPSAQTLEEMSPSNRTGTSIRILSEEFNIEDQVYFTFMTDNGKIWVEPGTGILPDTGYIPADKRYPAYISANFYDENMEPLANSEVLFSIKGENPAGMLRVADGREGRELKVRTDANGVAGVQYYYAASAPPKSRLTETIEAKTANMTTPFKAYVSTGLNLVIDNAKSGFETSTEINAGEEVPLKITVRDEWNPELDLSGILNYWGMGGNTGNNRLFIKLEIEKQGFVPKYLLDLTGETNFPESPYLELLYPKSAGGIKNLLYISEYSSKKAGFPSVKPLFSGINNYEVRVSLADEKGNKVFESPNPRRYAFLSIPTNVPADAFSVWFASNPLGPNTETARFARMLLSTVSLGDYGGFGSILSLADAAFAINSGDSEALTGIFLSEIKGQVFGDISNKEGLTGELFGLYNNISIAEQYTSFGLTTYSDIGLVAQTESKVLSEIARAGLKSGLKLVVLKGDGQQKLFIDTKPEQESKFSKTLKDNIKIDITGIDKKASEIIGKLGIKLKNSSTEVPVAEERFFNDPKLKTYSLKKGKVSVYFIPANAEAISENAVEMKIY